MYDLVESRRDLATFTGIGEAWPKVSVVIPALNEARNLPHVFAELPAGLHEVIVVDGHSVDDTVATARRLRPGVRIITQNRCGKGNALACGFAAATGDIIVMVDADGSADPAEIPRSSGHCWTARTSRRARGSPRRRQQRHHPAAPLGNRMLSGLVNVLCRHQVLRPVLRLQRLLATAPPGVRPGYRNGRPGRSGARLWGDGFEVETLINIRIAQAGLRVDRGRRATSMTGSTASAT